MIKIRYYSIRSIDETTFSLEIEGKSGEATNTSTRSENSGEVSKQQQLDLSQPIISSFKNKLKMFEVNYEIKFTNKESK